MLLMNLRLRVATRKAKVRQNVAALKTEEGAELARAAYVAERTVVPGGTFIDREIVSNRAQSFLDGLDADKQDEELESVEEQHEEQHEEGHEAAVTQQVQLPNALMRAFDAVSSDITGSMGPPTVNRTVAMRNRESSPLSLEEIGLGVTGVAAGMRAPESDSNVDLTLEGSPDEDNGAAAAIYSLEAAVECMERSARAGLAALPKAEFHGRTTWYALSDTTRKIKEDQRKRVTQLAVEGKKQSKQDLKTYHSDFCASCKADKKAFVTDIAEKMETASTAGDLKELNKQKKRL